MNRSTEINELATALAKAQAEMGAAARSGLNPAFKRPGTAGFRYATLDDVIAGAKVLAKHGLSFVQPARVEQDGAVTVETILMHSSGQWLSEALTLRPQQNTPQGVGSTLTYGRRYGLSSLVGIAADEDDDGNAASVKNGNGAPAPKISSEDAAKTVADWQKEIEAAPEASALAKVGARIAAARDAGALTTEQCEKELNLAYVTKVKALRPKEVKA